MQFSNKLFSCSSSRTHSLFFAAAYCLSRVKLEKFSFRHCTAAGKKLLLRKNKFMTLFLPTLRRSFSIVIFTSLPTVYFTTFMVRYCSGITVINTTVWKLLSRMGRKQSREIRSSETRKMKFSGANRRTTSKLEPLEQHF